jgi:hypothetical protein
LWCKIIIEDKKEGSKMKLFRAFNLMILLTFLFLTISPVYRVAASTYEVNYNVLFEKEDFPVIIVNVKNFTEQKGEFAFIGNSLGVVSDLKTVFKNIEVKNKDGQSIPWIWNDRKIVINNENFKDFTIKYVVDALNIKRDTESGPNAERFALFRFKRIFFIAGDIFVLPMLCPERITVSFSLPEDVSIFSSLPFENNTFIAVKDLWGDLVYDFQKSYFTGGQPLFTLTHQTEWGDKYIYIWFDRDVSSEAWLPSYGNTPWEQAEEYLETTEKFAKYYREKIGALPNHTVLFTNIIRAPSSFPPPVKTNADWFHYMQIWPRYSEPEICHHVFHQYSFFLQQSKLPFGWDKTGQMLSEGLPTYFEQTIPSLLFNDLRYKGKLFEFYIYEKRGRPFSIDENNYHLGYNIPALKVYLINNFIQKVTLGKNSVIDFVKALWDGVKDRTKPQMVTESDIKSAFTKIVGAENTYYLDTVVDKTDFELNEFKDLLPSFDKYASWMSEQYFWNKKLLFFVFLDISSAKGNEWPNFSTYPHNVLRYRDDALQKFKEYLTTKAKNPLTKDDIVNAMNYVTGKNHEGFFEFWESVGYNLDPKEIANFAEWYSDEVMKEEDFLVPAPFETVGTLKTQHYLSNIPQEAKIVLDKPDDDGQIFVDVQGWSFENFVPEENIKNVFNGTNVTFLGSYTFKYSNIYITEAVLKISTDDPNRSEFKVNLTFPSSNNYPRFAVSTSPNTQPIGVLYYLGPIEPIQINLGKEGNSLIMPDTSLENEYFIIKSSEAKDIKAFPGDKITIPSDSKQLEIYLYDKFDFLRGYSFYTIDITPPVLEVSVPEKTYESVIEITGKASDAISGIKDSSILINNEKVKLKGDSTFAYTLQLKEGENSITIIAEDNSGNKTEKSFIVQYIKRTILRLQIGSKTMYVNDSPVKLDVAPVITEGRTLLPIRWIAEPLGASVAWNSTERKVTITLKDTTIELWIGKNIAKVNGIDTPIDSTNSKVVPEIINSRTMLPLRFVTENLGCDVQWDGTTKTVTITYPVP